MLSVHVKRSFRNGPHPEFRLDISFTVGNGFAVLTGPSGSGKTSTLQLIAGILTPDEGRIEVGGRTYFDSARRIDLPIRQRSVGFVFQDYALFPHLTVEQNIAYGVKEADGNSRLAKASEMLKAFRIEHTKGRRPNEMSGGEQQRAALARALASGPAIVLLDEPLSAVDVETRAKLLDDIEEAQSRADVPFIYVTHNEAEAARFGRHRIMLRNGRVAE